MEITDYAVGTAVLNQFRDARVFHVGGSLLLGDLRRSWLDTGLRARDLAFGIEVLRQGSYVTLKVADPPEESVVSLLPLGASRISDIPPTWDDLKLEIGTALMLRRARRRLHPEAWLKLRSRIHHFDPERPFADDRLGTA